MPHLKKAELVEGVVYVGSPVRIRSHGALTSRVAAWLTVYSAVPPGTLVADNSTVRLEGDNEPQPDVFLMIEREAGGQAYVDEDDYVSGAPELVVEVAASSASLDLHAKLNRYRLSGVGEYVVWRVLEGRLDWLVLREGAYVPLQPDENGVIESVQFPGLRLAVAALLAGDMRTVLAVQQAGLRTARHRRFVRELAERMKRG